MKRLFIFALICLVLLACYLYPQSKDRADTGCGCQFVEDSLKDIQQIRVGMARKELLERFGTEGGIYTRISRQYVYKKCPYIKVQVTFEPTGNKAAESDGSPNDKIIEISKPYLEYGISD